MSDRDVKSWMERISSDVEMLKRRLIRRPGGGGGAYSPRRFQSKAELELWAPEDGAHAWVEADSSEYVRVGGQWWLLSQEGGAATLSRGTVGSLDTLYTVGRYRFDPSTEGLPVSGIWGFVDVVVDRGEAWNGVNNHMWQIAFSTGTVTRLFARNRVNDTPWRPWMEFSQHSDTGWKTLSLASGYTAHLGHTPQYRIINGVLYLRGTVKPTSGNLATSGQNVFTNAIPELVGKVSDADEYDVALCLGPTGGTIMRVYVNRFAQLVFGGSGNYGSGVAAYLSLAGASGKFHFS